MLPSRPPGGERRFPDPTLPPAGHNRPARLSVALAAVLTLLLAACGEQASATCTESRGAELCLATGGSQGTGPRIEVRGFAPGSQVTLEGPSGSASRLPVGPDGRLSGVLGILPGPVQERHRVSGLSSSGEPVAFVVTCSPDAGCSPSPA